MVENKKQTTIQNLSLKVKIRDEATDNLRDENGKYCSLAGWFSAKSMPIVSWHTFSASVMHEVTKTHSTRNRNILTCVLFHITEALEWPSLFLHGPLS